MTRIFSKPKVAFLMLSMELEEADLVGTLNCAGKVEPGNLRVMKNIPTTAKNISGPSKRPLGSEASILTDVYVESKDWSEVCTLFEVLCKAWCDWANVVGARSLPQ